MLNAKEIVQNFQYAKLLLLRQRSFYRRVIDEPPGSVHFRVIIAVYLFETSANKYYGSFRVGG